MRRSLLQRDFFSTIGQERSEIGIFVTVNGLDGVLGPTSVFKNLQLMRVRVRVGLG